MKNLAIGNLIECLPFGRPSNTIDALFDCHQTPLTDALVRCINMLSHTTILHVRLFDNSRFLKNVINIFDK